jgi:hypothetical protein
MMGMKREHLIDAAKIIIGSAMTAFGIFANLDSRWWWVPAVSLGIGAVMVGATLGKMSPLGRWTNQRK